MRTRLLALVMTCLAALATAGCLVETREVRDPRSAFDDARGAAARVQGRHGPARRLNVLAYDPGDHELTRVSLPLWLAKKAVRKGELDWDTQGEAGERALTYLRGRDLDKLLLGTLVEIEDDGERVLIWLD